MKLGKPEHCLPAAQLLSGRLFQQLFCLHISSPISCFSGSRTAWRRQASCAPIMQARSPWGLSCQTRKQLQKHGELFWRLQTNYFAQMARSSGAFARRKTLNTVKPQRPLEAKLPLKEQWEQLRLTLGRQASLEPRCHCKKNRKSATASGLPSGQICEGPGFLLLLSLEEEREEVSGSTFENKERSISMHPCCGSGSGSAGSVCFWASWIRLRILL